MPERTAIMRMNMLRMILIFLTAVLVFPAAFGCRTTTGTAREFPYGTKSGASRRLLENIPRSTAQPVAERIFRNHLRIDADNSSVYELFSLPKEIDPHSVEGKRIRDLLTATPNRIRQNGRLWLVSKGPHTMVYCQVLLQRLDTAERAAFADNQRGDDRPDDTPIERSGSTGIGSREEWVPAGRHRQTENLILDTIEKELSEKAQP